MLRNGENRDTTLSRIAERARRDTTATFNNLLSVLTVEFLAACFCRLRKDAAAGVDHVTYRCISKACRIVSVIWWSAFIGWGIIPSRCVACIFRKMSTPSAPWAFPPWKLIRPGRHASNFGGDL